MPRIVDVDQRRMELASAAARVIAKTGDNGYLWMAIGTLGFLTDERRRRQWLAAGLIGPLGIGVNFGIKLIFRRPRPVLEDLPPLGGAPSSLSFPSAHATASFASATAMSRIAPEYRYALFGVAAVMAVTRPYLGMHYPSDVLAGIALGTTVGALLPLPAAEPAEASQARRDPVAGAEGGSGPTPGDRR